MCASSTTPPPSLPADANDAASIYRCAAGVAQAKTGENRFEHLLLVMQIADVFAIPSGCFHEALPSRLRNPNEQIMNCD